MTKIENADVKNSEALNIGDVLKPYFRRWWWFLLSILLFTAYALYKIKKAVPVYNIKSTILIKDAKKSPSADMEMLSKLGGFGSMGTNSIENEIEILKSKKLMNDVVTSLDLQLSLIDKNGLKTRELYGSSSPVILKLVNEKTYDAETIKHPFILKINGNKLTISSEDFKNDIVSTFNKTINLPFANIIILKNPDFRPSKKQKFGELHLIYTPTFKATSSFQGKLNVDLAQKDATVLELSMDQPNVEKGKKIISSLILAYNNDAINDRNVESTKTKDFIDDRIDIIANELGEVESNKEQFKIANNITDIPAETALNLGNSATTRTQLLGTETQLALTNDLISYLSKLGRTQTLPSSLGIANPAASANITAYNQLILERNNLMENATPQNPLVEDLDRQISVLRKSVMDELLKNKVALETSRNQLVGEQNRLDSKIQKVPAQEKMFRNIERQQQIKENLYLLLLERREEAAISLAITSPKARLLDTAYASDQPVSPRKMMILAAALIFGTALPFAFIYLKELFRTKIRSKKDIEKLSSIPIMGELPSSKNNENGLVQVNDLSPMAEAFRIIVTNVNFTLPRKERGKVILVSSTIKGEGKTFVSMNLALTLASSNNKVLIIGSDIRNPQLQRYDKSKDRSIGLSEYLYEPDTKINQIIHQSTFNSNCDFIYSGSIPPNPNELLSNNRYEKLIEEVKPLYDYIILDTAPLLLVTDTFMFANVADVTVYVTRARHTEKSLIEFANKQVNEQKLNNVVFVLNDVHSDDFGYGNKYGYGYTQTEKSFLEKMKERLFST